jgi:hypothetical protein
MYFNQTLYWHLETQKRLTHGPCPQTQGLDWTWLDSYKDTDGEETGG